MVFQSMLTKELHNLDLKAVNIEHDSVDIDLHVVIRVL